MTPLYGAGPTLARALGEGASARRAVEHFHQTGEGWCRLAAEVRTIEFTYRRRDIRVPIYPRAAPAVIALERAIADLHTRTGIAPAVLTEVVLTGRLREADFQPVTWEFSVYAPIVGYEQPAFQGHLTVSVPDVRQRDLLRVYADLRRLWQAVAGHAHAAPPRRILTDKLAHLLRNVEAAGGAPPRNQPAFWRRQATRAGYATWTAAKQAHWRARQQEARRLGRA